MNKKSIKTLIDCMVSANLRGSINEREILRLKQGLRKNNDSYSEVLNTYFKPSYNITTNQAIKGKDYLIKKYLKFNGSPRVNANNIDCYFLSLIIYLYNGYDYYFTFDGFVCISNGWFTWYEPIYTLHVNDSEYSYFHYNGFDYAASCTSIDGYNRPLMVYSY